MKSLISTRNVSNPKLKFSYSDSEIVSLRAAHAQHKSEAKLFALHKLKRGMMSVETERGVPSF